MTPLLKKLLMGLGAVIVIGGLVLVLGNKAPTPSTGLVSSSTGTSPIAPATPANELAAEAQRQTDNLILLLQKVNNITLDTSIFESPDFIGLKDLSAPLAPDRNPGRTNPFLTIGSEARIEEPIVPDGTTQLDSNASITDSTTPSQNSVQ